MAGGALGLVWFAYLCGEVIYIKYWKLKPYKELLGEAINQSFTVSDFENLSNILGSKRGGQQYDGVVDSSP